MQKTAPMHDNAARLVLAVFSIQMLACSAESADDASNRQATEAWGTPWTLDTAFTAELGEVTGGDASLAALWLGTKTDGRYDPAFFDGWQGRRLHFDHLVITGSGKADPGQNDLPTFPYPSDAVVLPCLQSIGGVEEAYMIRTSNPLEARKRLLQYDVEGSALFGHSAGAWVAVVLGVLGGADTIDVYGVPFFFPIHGELDWGSTRITFHTHLHDPVGFAFDVPAMIGALEYNQLVYGDAQREHNDYRDPEPEVPPLNEDAWARVREYLEIRLEIARGLRTIETCWGKPCVPDHMGGAGL